MTNYKWQFIFLYFNLFILSLNNYTSKKLTYFLAIVKLLQTEPSEQKLSSNIEI